MDTDRGQDRRRLADRRGPGDGAGPGAAAGAGRDPDRRHDSGSGLAGSSGLGLAGILALTLGKVAAFVAFMLIVGRRADPVDAALCRPYRLARAVPPRRAGDRAGRRLRRGAAVRRLLRARRLLRRHDPERIRSCSASAAAEETLPLRDAFAVLFFVSVGMLFNPQIILTRAAAAPCWRRCAIILDRQVDRRLR